MKIAIIGTGHVGGALATQWSRSGHEILLAVQNPDDFKGKALLENPNTRVRSIGEAAAAAEVILMAIPPTAVFGVLGQVGELEGKVIIDATNSIGQSPAPYPTVYHCLADKTRAELVKCFNSTGFENMADPVYDGVGIDMFMAGNSERAKEVCRTLARDCGFGSCIDFGQADKVELLEKLAQAWINLAIIQGQGRRIAFRLVRR